MTETGLLALLVGIVVTDLHDHALVFATFDCLLENAEKIAGMTTSLFIKGLGLLLAGLSLGIIYFGGLWFTLRRFHCWRQPYLWLAVSWFGRLVVLLGGGAWLLNQAVAPPLLVILLVSTGVWLSRTLLIARLLGFVERSVAVTHSGVSRSHP